MGKGWVVVRTVKLIVLSLISLLISFFFAFTVFEVAKAGGNTGQFRAQDSYDLVIKNARMIDGSRGEIKRGEIGIRNGEIIKIGNDLKTDGAKILNAAGFTVAPQKVEWPSDMGWVKRDLATALKRYPADRIIISQARDKSWEGKSAQALIHGGLTLNDMSGDQTALAWIMPEKKKPQAEDVVTAFYLLTGWRGELLGEKTGKIEEGFKARLVVFNHREINDELLLDLLKQEKMPSLRYTIEGSDILVNEN